MLNETKGYFYQESVPNPERRGIPGRQDVKINVTKSSLHRYVFEHKTQLFFKGGFWKKRGGNINFFFSHPFSVLQKEDCVYCALGVVMTISESHFRFVRRYSATPLLSEHQQQGPRRKQPS